MSVYTADSIGKLHKNGQVLNFYTIFMVVAKILCRAENVENFLDLKVLKFS